MIHGGQRPRGHGAEVVVRRDSHRTASRRSQRGVTLMELMIAITLVAMLSTGLLMAMRTSLLTYDKVQKRLDINRRVVDVQELLTSQLSAAMAVPGLCPSSNSESPGAVLPFFYGDDSSMRFVTAYSIAEGARGYPQIVEYQVQPLQGGGVQLAVDEYPYTGLASTAPFCQDSQIRPVSLNASSIVVAGPLAGSHFIYHLPYDPFSYQEKPWVGFWNPKVSTSLPAAVRIDMLGLPGGALPVPSVTIPMRADRGALDQYDDQY